MAVANDSAEDPLDPQPDEAADAALELLKQLIALSSGLIAVGAAFAEKLLTRERIDFLLAVSWGLLAVSILAALGSMAAIVKSRLRPEFPWDTGIGMRMARVSRMAFVGGVLCFGTFAFVAGRREASVVSPDGGPRRATVVVHGRGGGVASVATTFAVDSCTIIVSEERP